VLHVRLQHHQQLPPLQRPLKPRSHHEAPQTGIIFDKIRVAGVIVCWTKTNYFSLSLRLSRLRGWSDVLVIGRVTIDVWGCLTA